MLIRSRVHPVASDEVLLDDDDVRTRVLDAAKKEMESGRLLAGVVGRRGAMDRRFCSRRVSGQPGRPRVIRLGGPEGVAVGARSRAPEASEELPTHG